MKNVTQSKPVLTFFLIFLFAMSALLFTGKSALASSDLSENQPAVAVPETRTVMRISADELRKSQKEFKEQFATERSADTHKKRRTRRSLDSDPAHTENFTQPNGMRLYVVLDSSRLNAEQLEKMKQDSNAELTFVVNWEDPTQGDMEARRTLRGTDLETLYQGSRVSLGDFRVQPDSTGDETPVFDYTVSIEFNDTVKKYLNQTLGWEESLHGNYILFPANEQTEFVKGYKFAKVTPYGQIPDTVTTVFIGRDGVELPKITGSFMRGDDNIMRRNTPVTLKTGEPVKARLDSNKRSYQDGDKTAVSFKLTGDSGDHVIQVGDRSFKYTSTVDMYQGAAVKLVEKVQTIFRNPDDQDFGDISAEGADQTPAPSSSKIAKSGFMGEALSAPTVSIKSAEPASGYKFMRWVSAAEPGKELSAQPVFDNTAEYLAVYKQKVKPVVPNPADGSVPELTDNDYVRLSFDAVSGKGYFGSKEDKKIKQYFDVLKGSTKAELEAQLQNPQAEVGYNFTGWDPILPDTIDQAQDFTAQYVEHDSISPTPLPGYVEVRFSADPSQLSLSLPDDTALAAKLTAQNTDFVVYVNPAKELSFTQLPKPKATAQIGYELEKELWALQTQGVDPQAPIKENRSYLAQAHKLDDIIEVSPLDPTKPFVPENPDDQNSSGKVPEGYVRVIFDAGEGSFGNYPQTQLPIKKRAFDVKKGLTWEKLLDRVPQAEAPAGMRFSGWNPALKAKDEPVEAGTYLAQYTKISSGGGSGSGDRDGGAGSDKGSAVQIPALQKKMLPKTGEQSSWYVGLAVVSLSFLAFGAVRLMKQR